MHNSEKTILKCLSSILHQEGIKERNVIIVDDRSDDKSTEIVKGYLKANPTRSIRLIESKTRLGAGRARNKGLQFVKTPLVAFVDSDIELPPYWTVRLFELVEKDNKGIAFSNICPYPAGYLAYVTERFKVQHKPSARFTSDPGGIFLCRTSLMKEFGGFDPMLIRGEDIDLSLRSSKKGIDIYHAKDVLCYHDEKTQTFKEISKKTFSAGKAGFILLFKHKSLKLLHLHYGLIGFVASALLLPWLCVFIILLRLPIHLLFLLVLFGLLTSSFAFCMLNFNASKIEILPVLTLFYSYLISLYSLGCYVQLVNTVMDKISKRVDKRVFSSLHSGRNKENRRIFFNTFYKEEDPWRISNNEVALDRYSAILRNCEKFCKRRNLVLDAGCGDGIWTRKIAEKAKTLVACDISRPAIKRTLKRCPTALHLVCDMEQLPIRSDVFDTVFCLQVLYYLKNPYDGFKEIYRVLKPKGYAMVSINNSSSLIKRILFQFSRKKITESYDFPLFSHSWLLNRSRSLGFVERESYGIIFNIPLLSRIRMFRRRLIMPLASRMPSHSDYTLMILEKKAA